MNKETQKIEEEKKPTMRQIIIETDGNDIKLVKAETAGSIELIGILDKLLDYLKNSNK